MLQLLKIHPEFHESTIQDQIDVKANNTPLGMAVVMVRGEYCTGIQQMQSGLGVLVIHWKWPWSSPGCLIWYTNVPNRFQQLVWNNFRTRRHGIANTCQFLETQAKLKKHLLLILPNSHLKKYGYFYLVCLKWQFKEHTQFLGCLIPCVGKACKKCCLRQVII